MSRSCADLPQIVDPGRIWSYSNSGYAILGRIVEVLTGVTFEQALRERLFTPLALEPRRSRSPTRRSSHPVAVGHVPDPADPSRLVVSPAWGLHRAFGPMGSAVVASAGDVMRFVGAAPVGGLAPDGTRLLDANLVNAMQAPQIGLVDDTVLGEAWGLGWILDHFGDVAVIGHDGNSSGQNAFMRVAPAERFGFCLQTNVESALTLYRELADWLFGQRLGVTPRRDPACADRDGDRPETLRRHLQRGWPRHRRARRRREPAGRHRDAQPRHRRGEQDWPPMVDLPLQPVAREDSFLLSCPSLTPTSSPSSSTPTRSRDRPTYLHYGGRAHRRTSLGRSAPRGARRTAGPK